MSDKQLPDGIEWPRYEDGAPIAIGDEVYLPISGRIEHVKFIQFSSTYASYTTEEGHVWEGSRGKRAHRPPVLDKDGTEIKVGDTVWQEADGTKLRVIYFGHKEDGERMVGVERISGPTDWAECRSGSLTHIEPDSWEKLREDTKKFFTDYWGCRDFSCGDCPSTIGEETPGAHYECDCTKAQRLDVLARAEKLAGVMGIV